MIRYHLFVILFIVALECTRYTQFRRFISHSRTKQWLIKYPSCFFIPEFPHKYDINPVFPHQKRSTLGLPHTYFFSVPPLEFQWSPGPIIYVSKFQYVFILFCWRLVGHHLPVYTFLSTNVLRMLMFWQQSRDLILRETWHWTSL